MYFVKYGVNYLHDPRVNGCYLLDLALEQEENSCGYCEFTIYPNHPMYSKLKERDADNPITVYDDETELFTGFIYELGKEFYLDGQVKCKGDLDYLSESILRPYSTVQRGYGLKAPDAIGGYFEWLIEQHNNQATSNKRFVVGVNQIRNLVTSGLTYQENSRYPTVMDEISEKLLKTIGGYLRVRHENGTRYIDYLSEWTESNTQILEFGVNLTDYSQTDDSSDICTFIVPLGAQMSDTEYSYKNGYAVTTDKSVNTNKTYYTKSEDTYSKCVNLKTFETGTTYYEYSGGKYSPTSDTTVNSSKTYYIKNVGGYSQCSDLKSFASGTTYYEYTAENDESSLQLTLSGMSNAMYEPDYQKYEDMIYHAPSVQKYGWIGGTFSNTDIKDRETLLSEGTKALKELVSPKRTIEIKAVDMHLINSDIKPIRVGEYVRVRSKPHNLDSYFLCREISLDLNNPENSQYTLGTTFDTLTGQQNKKINELNSTINKQYEAAAAIGQEAKDTAKTANENAASAKEAADAAILSIEEEYAVSLTRTAVPTDGWATETPSDSDKYVWHRLTTTYGDGTVVIGEPALLTGPNGEDAILLRIDSSRGTVFKNDSISTVLNVVIYNGPNRITESSTLHAIFGSGAYLQWYWQRLDDESFGVISSSDSMLSNDGFSLTISPDQVDTKVTFMCELIIP